MRRFDGGSAVAGEIESSSFTAFEDYVRELFEECRQAIDNSKF
jgi:hypothetical protein